jgi:hypothetical protein
MSVINQQPVWQPRPQPRVTPQSVTITSQVIYAKGPWGSQRPVRNFANVDVKARHYHTSLGKFTTVETLGSTILDGNGEFTLTTSPLPLDTDDIFLEIQENYTNEVFVYQLIDPKNPGMSYIDRNRVGKQYLGDIKHRLRVPWWPTKPDLASVNATAFADTQKLARSLTFQTKAPTSYPQIITLLRESADGYLGQNYTTAQQMFYKFIFGQVPADFPAKLVDELKTVPNIGPIATNSIHGSLISVLERLVTVNIDQLENGPMLNPLLRAIGNALDSQTGVTQMATDAAPDMAVACTMLFLAALIARDNAKCTVSFGTLSYAEMQMRFYDAIYISVTK